MSDAPEPRTLHSDVPSNAPPEPTVELIVDGEKQTWTQSKLVAQAQKFVAAEKRLQEASETAKKYAKEIELGRTALKLGSKDETEKVQAFTALMEAAYGLDADTSHQALNLFKEALSAPQGDTRMADTAPTTPPPSGPTPAQEKEFLLQINQLPPDVQEIAQAFKDAGMSP